MESADCGQVFSVLTHCITPCIEFKSGSSWVLDGWEKQKKVAVEPEARREDREMLVVLRNIIASCGYNVGQMEGIAEKELGQSTMSPITKASNARLVGNLVQESEETHIILKQEEGSKR